MNYFGGGLPENVNSYPMNEEPGNPYGMGAGGSASASASSPSNAIAVATESTSAAKRKPPTFGQKLVQFMNTSTGTILTTGCAMAIGAAFNNLASSIINNVIQPLILQIIVMLNLNSVYDFQSLISPENNVLNMRMFVNSFFTFVIVLLTVYFMNLQINNFANGGSARS